ncbi:MAG TPA: hypothetical protein DHV15_13260 [Treponema sp.]|uniref:Uncharacterized protein n=2 Tax=Treponemataceae TaxID=2845253 RepID=Q73NJ1_TREDE|nr:hypothetical protein [Treponema denticola]AAS11650.1 hypothetical protein TDE_1161 [Treponema denticola ATCC 35405]HCY96456.1 hypothetical protein [Treponema sp.]
MGEPFMITNLFIIISGARIFLLQKILELLPELVKARYKEFLQLYHSPILFTKRVTENTHYLKTRIYKWQTAKL